MIDEENEMTYCIKYEMCKHLPALDSHDCNMFTTFSIIFSEGCLQSNSTPSNSEKTSAGYKNTVCKRISNL